MESVIILLLTYMIWVLLIRIVSDIRLKDIWVLPVLMCISVPVSAMAGIYIHIVEKVFIIIGLCIVTDCEAKEKLKSIVTAFTVSSVIEMIIYAIGEIFKEKIPSDNIGEITARFVCICVLILIYFIKKHIKSFNRAFRHMNYEIAAYMVIGILCFAVSSVTDYIRYGSDRLYDYSIVLSVYTVLIFLLLILFLIYIMVSSRKILKSYHMEKMFNEEQKMYYETLLKKEEDTRKFRHDITNHLICLGELAEKSGNDIILNYINKMTGDIEKIKYMSYSTGNRIIDISMNYYISKLDEGISVKLNGVLRGDLEIDENDLSVIFGNLFKNIWEELQNCDDGYIWIRCISGERQNRIVVENSLDKNVKNQALKKNRLKNFGYGMENIKRAVKRNNGTYEFTKTDESYRAELTFKCKTTVGQVK